MYLVEYVLTFKYYDNIDDDLHVCCLLTSTLFSLNLTRFSLIGHNQIVLGLNWSQFFYCKITVMMTNHKTLFFISVQSEDTGGNLLAPAVHRLT